MDPMGVETFCCWVTSIKLNDFTHFDFDPTCWFQCFDSNRSLFSIYSVPWKVNITTAIVVQGDVLRYLPIRWTQSHLCCRYMFHKESTTFHHLLYWKMLWFLDDWMMLGCDSSVIQISNHHANWLIHGQYTWFIYCVWHTIPIQIWWILNSHLNSSKFGNQSCLWLKQIS